MTRILVGTTDGLVGIDGDHALTGRVVTALSAERGRTWALLDGRVLAVERDGWRDVASLPEGAEGTSLLATPDRVLVGTDGADLFELDGTVFARIGAFDDAPARATWYTPWGGPPAVRSMTDLDGELFANVHVGGILRSRDLRTWEQTIDIDTDVHQVVHDDDGRLFAALGVEGVGMSDDHGDSWAITTEGLHGGYVRAAVIAGDALIVAASTGPFTKHAALYRHPRASTGTFERCTTGLPDRFSANIDTHWLAASSDTVAVVTPDGDVFTSADEGSTWEQAAKGVGEPQCLLVR